MNICGVDFSFNFTGFQLIYVMVANIMWIVSLLFSREYMAHSPDIYADTILSHGHKCGQD